MVSNWKDNIGLWHTVCELYINNDLNIIKLKMPFSELESISLMFQRENICEFFYLKATDIKFSLPIIKQTLDKYIGFSLKNGNDVLVELNTEDHVASKPSPESDSMVYYFNQITVDVEGYDISLEGESIIKEPESGYNSIVIESTINIRLKSKDKSNVISLHKMPSGTQYMQIGPYRTRLNTLFSRKLAERANIGIDNVLSMEPQLGLAFLQSKFSNTALYKGFSDHSPDLFPCSLLALATSGFQRKNRF
ncbi:hypothetical protein [Xenorhabdus bovienii]|uniref:hypothetical protein n=1 Tax=Xenorhabdus bovienii TaxID=40576 RepID=UPI00237CC37B|nr:hypothetical protein [Xenorhabdus bovienii]MDE1474010.1 hypothetical protein [Xenorhabdus bovienii]